MLISPEIWQNRSQWNNFRIIYGDYKLFIRFNVLIETKRLSVIGLDPIKVERLELIRSLFGKGLSYRLISDYLNYRGLLSPNGHRYYPKLIWTTLSKYTKRLERLRSSTKVIDVSERLYLRPIRSHKTKTD